MISKELLEIISKINNKLDDNYSENTKLNKKENILASMVKLSEEIGELSNELLISIGRARQHKIDNFKKEDLEGEFADVILSTLALADLMDIDLNKALKNKLQKIEDRGGV